MGSSNVIAIPAIEMSALFNKPEGMARTKWRTETVEQVRNKKNSFLFYFHHYHNVHPITKR